MTGSSAQGSRGGVCGAEEGAPVLGRPGPAGTMGAAAATEKHSDVALVCVAAANTPVAATSGVYSVRQQYLPSELVAVVGSDVAAPPTSGLAAPTRAPPAGHPGTVVLAAETTKTAAPS